MQPPSVSPTRQLERTIAAEDARRQSRLFDSPSEPSHSPSKSRQRLSLDELAFVQFGSSPGFADTTGRITPPVSLEAVADSPAAAQPSHLLGLPELGRAVPTRPKRPKGAQLYERSSSDPGSIMHGSSLSELGTLRARLRRPRRLDPYHDPIPRTAVSTDPWAASPSRNLGLRGKTRSQPRLATLSPKRYGSYYSKAGANGGSWKRQLETADHGSSVALDRPRAVARGNMTVCLTRPSTQSALRRSASDPTTTTRVGRTPTPPLGSTADWKHMLQQATWADERPSALEWQADPELGEPGLPHLRRALRTASGFQSKHYILLR